MLADKLVDTTLTTMFRKLHTERNGWNLSLINIAVTNMAETAADSKDSEGRDIGRMLRRQDEVLKDFKLTEPDSSLGHSGNDEPKARNVPADSDLTAMPGLADDPWDSDDQAEVGQMYECRICRLWIPTFAKAAHLRYHDVSEN